MADPTLSMQRRSPLAGVARDLMNGTVTGPRHVRISENRFTTMISLRVDPGSAAGTAIGEALGAPLPVAVGEIAESGANHVLWLGPDEWLIVSQADAEVLVPALEAVVPAGANAAIVDVSANRTVVEITGAAAREVLEKGCPTDLHPRAFAPGRAVTTTLAKVPLLLWQTGPQTYRLLPRASFAEYVAAWLLDAAQEFSAERSTASATESGL